MLTVPKFTPLCPIFHVTRRFSSLYPVKNPSHFPRHLSCPTLSVRDTSLPPSPAPTLPLSCGVISLTLTHMHTHTHAQSHTPLSVSRSEKNTKLGWQETEVCPLLLLYSVFLSVKWGGARLTLPSFLLFKVYGFRIFPPPSPYRHFKA